MKTGKTLQELAIEIERQNKVKKDYVAGTDEMMMMVAEGGEKDQGVPVLSLRGMNNPFGVNEIAHNQIGTKLGIPSKYYDRMRVEQPELLAENVNTWFQKQPSRRMVRTLDGTARAFLSDRYRRIDNYEIANAVLPMIANMKEVSVESCEITERRMYLKVLNPRITTEIVKGDVVQSGFLISNSETGLGSVSVMPLVYRLVCTNGMIAADSGKRKHHVGRHNDGDDESFEIYRSETIQADDRAFVMKLQDIVRATADSVHFERIVSAMRTGTAAKITGDVPGVVELASKTYGLFEKESQGVLDHLIRGEDLSLYGLANAVTRHAQDVQSYDRSTELEMTAWQMLNMSRRDWENLNVA
ncbi:hypothetical protein FACS189468_5600 [Spirochaetia bacterium]|nr:hypothetical protein FACS189468_5600 [Spirochaetia bacterium]